MNLMNGRYGTFDLSSRLSAVHELPDNCAEDPSSMLSTVDAAISDASDDAIAVASGILTGSLLPAACSGFVRTSNAHREADRMCPLLGFAGVELKLSGFDFIVISGEASEHGYIWVRDGIMDFVPMPNAAGLDSWERTDSIRSDQGDKKIQVIATGPWADSEPDASQLVVNYWGGEDKIGCAAELSSRKLSAVAFRGMGELEVDDPEDHFASSLELFRTHLAGLGVNHGLASFSSTAAGEAFAGLLHRNVACYGCPFPCRSYYKLDDDSDADSVEKNGSGYLVYDIAALEALAFLGMDARDSVKALMRCARFGAEPLSIADTLSIRGSGVTIDTIDDLLKSGGPAKPQRTKSSGRFSDSFDDVGEYVACLAMGLCPRYWARVGLDRDAIIGASESGTGRALDLR